MEAVDHTSAIPAGYATGTTWRAAANILAVFFWFVVELSVAERLHHKCESSN